LLYATLGHLADAGMFDVYTTAPDLLDHLRAAIRDQNGNAQSERLRRMAAEPVLAIDELDKYRPTAYADEAIFKLFDAHYRAWATTATLIAYNDASGIPLFLRSWTRDGRFRLIEIGGPDLRPALRTTPP
jgi:DNA replication protein DnaC